MELETSENQNYKPYNPGLVTFQLSKPVKHFSLFLNLFILRFRFCLT